MIVFCIIFLFLVIFFIYLVLPHFHSLHKKNQLDCRAKNKKAVFLTFDDGPGSRLTPQILQILKEHNIKATFFLLGRNIIGREDIVKQIMLQGHQVASHGYDHLNYWKVLPWAAIRDIKKGWEAIDNVIGTKNRRYPFRPPYGKLNIFSLIYLLVNKVPICYWTVVSGDTYTKEQRSVDAAASIIKAKGSGVVLAHDFDRGSDYLDSFVIESLKRTIDCAVKHNMKFMTFSEIDSN